MLSLLLLGLLIVFFLFPRWDSKARARMVKRWSTWLLSALHIQIKQHRGHALYDQCLGDIDASRAQQYITVANHISWLDIFVINAVAPMRFVAKADIRDWPLVGPLCAGTGTIFIERQKRTALRDVIVIVKQALKAGDRVAVFPEGTTGDTKSIRAFHSNFLQVAVDEQLTVLPLAMRYVDAKTGGVSDATLFIDDTTFIKSCLQVCGEPQIIAELFFTEPIAPSAQWTRQSLSHRSREQICGALGLPTD